MTKLISPEFRGSFVSLVTPRGIRGDASSTPKFQITIALDKKDAFWGKVKDAIEEAAKDKFGKVPPRLKSPLKDGDVSGYDNLEGMLTLGASNTRRPGVVGPDLQPVLDPDVLFSGAWYRASIRPYAWSHPTGGKGVSFSLDNVMYIRGDEAFDGSATAETDFSEYAVEQSSGGEDDLLG